MAKFKVRPFALREINKHLDYLEAEAGLETAERFLHCLLSSFQAIANMKKLVCFADFASQPRAVFAVGVS